MNEFSKDQRKMIYEAVRYYQMNKCGPFSKTGYDVCDEILNTLYNEVNEFDRPECDI